MMKRQFGRALSLGLALALAAGLTVPAWAADPDPYGPVSGSGILVTDQETMTTGSDSGHKQSDIHENFVTGVDIDDKEDTTSADAPEDEPAPVPRPTSPAQPAVKELVDWIERIDPPAYAQKLYDVLAADRYALLASDVNFALPGASSASEDSEVTSIESVDFQLDELFADGLAVLDASIFQDEDFYQVDAAKADRQVDYAALEPGDVVRTASFNGVYITSIPKDAGYDEAKKAACSYISTVFQAFDRDHPEVFWLSGKCQVRMPSVRAADGTERAYFFLVLANDAGFTMRAPDWTEQGVVADGVQRRDQAVEEILGTVTAETPAEQVRQLNRWLTEHDQYNTTPDLTTIGNEPHECLSALEGRIGEDGPVCDGYSRAFKTLCDRLEIPCVLENGYAKTSVDDKGTLHMWNAVEIDGQWYGVDVTWNDPTVKDFVGAKSGKENEQFLLVGSSTVALGMTFAVSHPATNRASADGVSFDNGPKLSNTGFSLGTANAGLSALPFSDVAEDAWYHGAVAYVYENGLMMGTSGDRFSPGGLTTRQQLWMILARMDGQQPKDMAEARVWAMDSGVSDGTDPGGTLTREQLVSMLYRYCAGKGHDVSAAGSLVGFPDGGKVSGYAQQAMSWAVANGIVAGMADGTIVPQGTADRAQMATVIQRLSAKL